ncbi:hypothetical protein LJC20_00135 [Eubacteriales bacterium OttesenSCG-928-M02]|nr:hypothetical protein [Eubacteriales bacterium OttesenSCG-928-M02]
MLRREGISAAFLVHGKKRGVDFQMEMRRGENKKFPKGDFLAKKGGKRIDFWLWMNYNRFIWMGILGSVVENRRQSQAKRST